MNALLSIVVTTAVIIVAFAWFLAWMTTPRDIEPPVDPEALLRDSVDRAIAEAEEMDLLARYAKARRAHGGFDNDAA